MEENKNKKKGSKVMAELKKYSAVDVLTFSASLLALFLVIRYVVSRFFIAGTSYFIKPLTSCPGTFVAQKKFYDIFSYFVMYIRHGTVLKYFYFVMVPAGIYLIMTRLVWKKATKNQKIISLIIGIGVAIILYLLAPSWYVCNFDFPVLRLGELVSY